MRLSEAAATIGAHQGGGDVEFLGASTDSRTLQRDALFVALTGDRYDGHDFLAHAEARGAAAAMVSDTPTHRLPTLFVEDTLASLGRLAGAWRDRFDVPLLAITGSNGKTTVKEMLAAILRESGPVLSTTGNLNNEIGVPLTLLGLDALHRAAVIELGANHAGEIARLTRIARPVCGLITQCAPAHLEGFGSVRGVARAKGELLENLHEQATAVINADDEYAGLWRALAGRRRCLTFGLQHGADVVAEWDEGVGRGGSADGSHLRLHTPLGMIECRMSLPGRHNVANAAAAVAGAIALEVPAGAISAGLERVRPVAGRLQCKQAVGGARIIDDSYNANPVSLRAGLEVLAAEKGRRWLVLGDMAELGPDAGAFHEDAARMARDYGVERLYATGELAAKTVATFGDGAEHYASQDDLIAALDNRIPRGVTVLVKGSRSMHMERVVAALAARG